MVSGEIEAAAAWVMEQADAVKTPVGMPVSEAEASFARQRIIAIAGGLLAGLHLPDAAPQVDAAE